ncbi:MAG: alpha/beta hydrolase [Clostridia bacterium]|nr:alpha/beta hydrolase [Clostridia bacterium]
MIEELDVTIPALTGDKKRKAYVYLPVGYVESDESYPVLYMFDGQNLFDDEKATYGKSWGIADYLDFTDTPLIVAGVECNREGTERLSEYGPFSFDFMGKRIKGKGKLYADWLAESFKPMIDGMYRTLPGREDTAVGGSSMGGLMTLYVLAKHGKTFSKGAALSPSLWLTGELPGFIKNSKFEKDTLIYTDYGSEELKNHEPQRQAFIDATGLLIEKNVFVTSRIVPFGTHSEESWRAEVPNFMNILGFGPGRW